MSLNAAHIHTMIVSNSRDKAEKQMLKLVELSGEKIVYHFDGRIKTETKSYTAKKWSRDFRGYRYQEVYVDRVFEDTEEMDVIKMYLRPNDPYDYNYNYSDHIYYF